MKKTSVVLVFDIGTQSTRALLVSSEGKILAKAQKGHHPAYVSRKSGWAEQDPSDWSKAAISTIKSVVEKGQVNGKDVRGIGISGQMHGLVMLNEENQVIRRSIIWCDQRATKQVEEMLELPMEKKCHCYVEGKITEKRMDMSKALFITGTGTDIGKTYVTGLIVKKLAEEGKSAAYYKAAMSGNDRRADGSLIPGDALFVQQMSGITQSLEEMCPYVYEHAYSPHLASRIEGHPVEMDVVRDGYKAVCDKYDALLIFDEIQTGVGRTGKWFAYMHSGVKPDVLTFAKGIGGGFPMGGFGEQKEKLAHVFKPGDHGSTFGGNPLACAAAYACLTAIKAENLVDKAAVQGTYFKGELEKLQQKYPDKVKEVRGRGLILGMELCKEGKAVVESCLQEHVIVNCTAGNVIRLVPPLIVTKEEIDIVVAALDKALAAF